MAVERPRRVQVQPFPSSRRLVTAAMRAGRRIAPMVGLVDVDVTEANRLLAAHEPPSSLTAFGAPATRFGAELRELAHLRD